MHIKASRIVKSYLLEKSNYRCNECGFSGTNPYTGNTILQIEHIDGDKRNNTPDNLKILCPNCHAMTKTFAGANTNNPKRFVRPKYFHS